MAKTDSTSTSQSNDKNRRLYGTAARLAGQEYQPDPVAVERHNTSVKKYPMVDLSPEEYVIADVHRHPIGIFSIWFLVGTLLAVLFGALSVYSLNRQTIASNLVDFGGTAAQLPSAASLFPLILLAAATIVLGGVIATIVYEGNEFYLTNEAIFQRVQTSLFNTQTQVVNLINVEDASQDKRGLLQQVLNYGTLKVSTQGEETTYHFYFVANPEQIVNTINTTAERAVMKMQGMPVTEH